MNTTTTVSLADPLMIGGVRLRNRLVATAHGTASVVDGMPDGEDARYWERLSRGGPGMIITGGTQVAKESLLRNRYLSEAFRRETIPGLRARAAAISSGGAVSVVQLGHLGRETLGANTTYPFVAPSDVISPREPAPSRVLSTAEVADIVDAFVASARNSVDAGFDVVELHGAHGYLIAQFLNAHVNTRTDRYGGSATNRVALVVEIIEGIRAALLDVPVGLRVSVENDHNGLSLDDFAELLSLIQERAPFDYLNLTYGSRGYYVRDMATTRPPLLGHTGELRSAIGVPLLLCSAFRKSADMTEALTSGAADMVGMARAHMADPEVSNKILQGREDEVRPCVACLEDCRSFDPTALCTVNPDLAPRGQDLRPGEAYVVAGPRAGGSSLAIVGAGPAGLECALTVARAGVGDVTVFDASDGIGGALAVATAAPNRSGWQDLLRFYERRLNQLDVTVKLGSPVSGTEAPDGFEHVVWAVGADELPRDIPGGLPVLRSTDYLGMPTEGRAWKTVVVLDDGFGWWPTVSSVEAACDRGAERVVVVTPATGFAAGIPAEARMQLMERLSGCQLDVVPISTVRVTEEGAVVLEHTLTGETRTLTADGLVTVGARHQRDLPAWEHPSTWAVGDCLSPRRVSHAVTEGRHAGRAVLAALTAD